MALFCCVYSLHILSGKDLICPSSIAALQFITLPRASPVHKAVKPGEALPGVRHRDDLAIQVPADGGRWVPTSHTLQR